MMIHAVFGRAWSHLYADAVLEHRFELFATGAGVMKQRTPDGCILAFRQNNILPNNNLQIKKKLQFFVKNNLQFCVKK